jgi:uncharacterized protein YodC (DUF2158 family)
VNFKPTALVFPLKLFRTGRWQRIPDLLSKWRVDLLGPVSKFKIGDRIQMIEGGKFMLVTEIIALPKMKEPLIQCKWYDPETHETKMNIISEGKIRHFDGKPPRKNRIRHTTAEVVAL